MNNIEKWKCPECNGYDVEMQGWIKINTYEVTGGHLSGDVEDYWCCDCEEHIQPIEENEHPADKDDRLYHEEQDHKAMEKANDR